MSLPILQAINDKKTFFPTTNRLAIERQVPGILSNFRQIKGRNYDRSVIYRQVGRDDYHQPSFIEQFFDFFAAVSFRSEPRGELILGEVESWRGWRNDVEASLLVPREFWQVEEETDSLLSQVRRAYIAGDALEQRVLLIKIRQNVDAMLRLTVIEGENG